MKNSSAILNSKLLQYSTFSPQLKTYLHAIIYYAAVSLVAQFVH